MRLGPLVPPLLAVAASGCGARCSAEAPAVAPPLPVEVAGCAALTAGPRCELGPARSLRLLAEAPEGVQVRISSGGALLDESAGGLRTVTVPAGATQLTVQAGPARFHLAVGETSRPAALDRAAALLSEGKADQAEEVLRALERSGSPDDAARARSGLARLAMHGGRTGEAVAALLAAAEAHRALGHRSEEVRDTLAAAYALIQARRFAEARAALDRLGPVSALHPEARAEALYDLGLVHRDAGDLRSALRRFDEAEGVARRFGMDRQREAAAQGLATALLAVGRYEEALGFFQSLRPVDPCDRASLHNNVGWALLLAREADTSPSAADPEQPLEEALALFRTTCARPVEEANTLINLALADLQVGRAERAAERLAAARRARPTPDTRVSLWWLDVQGRIELQRKNAGQALSLYRQLAALALASAAPEARWRAAIGRGEALERAGDLQGALAAHVEAERLLDQEVLQVPLTEGRESFLGDRDRGARALVSLLVRLARPAEAMDAARRARGRALESLRLAERLGSLDAAARGRWERALGAYRQARAALDAEAAEDWKLSARRLAEVEAARRDRERALRAVLDEAMAAVDADRAPATPPRRPGPGELLLLWYPGERGWHGFAATASEIQVRAIPALPPADDPAALGAALFGPFDRAIAGAERVTLLPAGALRPVDLHALPWRGAPLLESRPVAYGLDLRTAGARRPAGGRALVIGDPQSDLPRARQEAAQVRAALEAADAGVDLLSGEAASIEAVRARLAAAPLLHYAGHGRFAGAGGWDSALPLADGALSVGELLALPAPPTVVLSGCETARGAAGPLEGLGLAQAFLLAGAGGVIAASRPVEDALAARMTEAIYANAGSLDPPRMAEVARRAQLKVRAGGGDWAAFRALVP